MSVSQTPTIEQWLLLCVFFLLFAIYGFTRQRRDSGCRPCYYITFGLLALVANSLVLLLTNRAGITQFDVLQLVMLKQSAIESSFIVIGYCLIIQGIAMLLRSMLTPASVRASKHYF